MLDDKYRIERLLAVGGMGAVYLGTHIKLRKRVAIKVLNPQLSSPPMVERFHREAITASQIGHEGIAQVTDIGTSLQGEPFLVMEYLEGESLAGRLRASGPLAVEVACELGCAILSPLAAAHGAGIVHRDLKPDNVYLVRQSRGEMVKLLDFGISRAAGLEGEFRLTTTGLVLGTPYYMSPEQARGDGEITTAADLYAFGVILYEMLCGVVPIHAENYNQLMYRVMTGDFVPPRQRSAHISPELEQLILQTMALDPAHRPRSAADLEQALLAFCRPTFREHTIERISASNVQRASLSSFPPGAGTDRTLLVTPAEAPVPRPLRALARPGAGTVARAATAPAAGPTGAAPFPASAPTRSRALSIALVLVAGAAIAAFVVLDKDREPETGGTGSAGTKAVAVNTPAAEPVTPDAAIPADSNATDTAVVTPATVTLRFAIEPASSKILVDGKPVQGGELVVTKDDAAHTLRITAAGHATHDEPLRFDESQRIAIQLKPVTRPSKPGKPRKPGKPERIDTSSPYQ